MSYRIVEQNVWYFAGELDAPNVEYVVQESEDEHYPTGRWFNIYATYDIDSAKERMRELESREGDKVCRSMEKGV